jgi:hypothetical protein
MVYCNVACVSLRRDQTEATYDKQRGNVLPAVEAPTGVKHTADDLGQERSLLPLKGGWGAAAAADVARQDDRMETGQVWRTHISFFSFHFSKFSPPPPFFSLYVSPFFYCLSQTKTVC